jgi:N-methylhydantoinase B
MVLWRKIRANSGGAGTYRGGQGAETALAIRGVPQLRGPAFSSVSEAPARGAGGGLPAAASHYHLIRSSNIDGLFDGGVMPTEGTLDGAIEQPAAKVGSITVRDGDVFIFTGNGGGGVGDALIRNPEAVLWDLSSGYITAEAALSIYGVVVDKAMQLDVEATAQVRDAMRTDRIGRAPTRTADAIGRNGGITAADGTWVCLYCREPLGDTGANFRDSAVLRETDLVGNHERHEMHIRARPADDARFVLREYFCPACASSIVVDVTLAGSETVRSPKLAAVAARS